MKLYWCDSLTTRLVPGKCCVLFHKDYFDILETHRSMLVQGFAQVVKAQNGDPFPLFVMTKYSVVSAMFNTIPFNKFSLDTMSYFKNDTCSSLFSFCDICQNNALFTLYIVYGFTER